MTVVDALPPRPLNPTDLEALSESNAIEVLPPVVLCESCGGVVFLGIELPNSKVVGLGFDHEANEWRRGDYWQ